jgi:hypothetical protein
VSNARHPHDATPPPEGGDGVRVVARGAGAGQRARVARLLALLIAIACVAAVAWLWLSRTPTGTPAAAMASTAQADRGDAIDLAQDPATGLPRAVANTDAAAAKPAPDDLAAYIRPGEEAPTMNEVIARLHAAGVREGLGAFNPPGTSPPLVGIAVPENYPLPEGYVRHYQATDDGQRIEAILMFSPDYTFRDANGQPIQVPDNRVVPPQYAPPGLTVRYITIPPPLDPGRP